MTNIKKETKKDSENNKKCECGKCCEVQDLFLSRIAEEHTSVTVFLMCGVRLQGIVTSYDKDTLLLKREGHTQLVFKHAISTIMPAESIQFAADEKEDGAEK